MLPFWRIQSKYGRAVLVFRYPGRALGIPERLAPAVIVEQALPGPNGLIIVVVDGHPQFVLNFRRLSGDLPVDIDVAIDYLHPFARKADQAFDVVYGRLGRILEDDHVPSLGIGELVNALEDQDSVAVGNGHLIPRAMVVTTTGAASNRRLDINRGNRIFRYIVISRDEAVIVGVAALLASKPEMGTFEGVCHAAGRNAKRLHHERSEYERQNEGGNQPLESVRDLGGSILFMFDVPGRFAFCGLFPRHKCPFVIYYLLFMI